MIHLQFKLTSLTTWAATGQHRDIQQVHRAMLQLLAHHRRGGLGTRVPARQDDS
jgi:hypothetical protein